MKIERARIWSGMVFNPCNSSSKKFKSMLLTTELNRLSTIWPFQSVFNPNHCNLSGHHVISLQEQLGYLRTNIEFCSFTTKHQQSNVIN